MSALRKVLVVDDDPVVGKSFDRVLSGKGYAVITAGDAQEALHKLEAEKYDLVFTDIKMPGMSGLEMAEQMRQRQPWLPVVIVTGYGSPDNEARAEAAGVSAFLRKPLSPEMIEDSAKSVLSQATMPAYSAAVEQAAVEQAAAAPAPATGLPNFARFVKNVALFLAAPFVGLAYILAFPIVGLGMLVWMAVEAQQKKSAEVPKHVAPVASSALKSTATFLAAPFIGLAYIIVGPIIGLGMLAWFGMQAWGKMGAKALNENSETK